MTARDFDNRFEDTLRSNKLEFTVEATHEPGAAGISWDYKKIRIKPRASFDPELLVTLIRTNRPVRYRAIGRRSHKCFVVETRGSKSRVQWGLRNVWLEIKIRCLPL